MLGTCPSAFSVWNQGANVWLLMLCPNPGKKIWLPQEESDWILGQ